MINYSVSSVVKGPILSSSPVLLSIKRYICGFSELFLCSITLKFPEIKKRATSQTEDLSNNDHKTPIRKTSCPTRDKTVKSLGIFTVEW